MTGLFAPDAAISAVSPGDTTINLEGADGYQVGVGYRFADVTIVFDNLTGWYAGAGVRSNMTDRPNDHGSFDGPSYRTGRVIAITGTAFADTRSQVALALDAIAGVLGEGDLGTLTVVDDDYGTLSAQVRISDEPQIDWSARASAWSWQVQFTAPDPRKYGPPVSQSTGLPVASGDGMRFPLFGGTGLLEFGAAGDPGQVTLANPGSADTNLTFEVTGPVLGGVVLTEVESGRSIVYAADLESSGVLLIVDSATGRATLNGADRSGELTVKQWWPVKRRSSSTVQFSTLGVSGQAGQLTATIRPAYW